MELYTCKLFRALRCTMLKRLLKCGYFPDGLPPLFVTSGFADLVAKQKNLPQAFVQAKPLETKVVCHNLARSGGLRRKLSINNPINFFRLAKLFNDHENELRSAWDVSPYSLSKPSTARHQRRALGPKNRQRSIESAKRRVAQRFLVRTDISDFYPSIYTHSLPWALHGKSHSKKNKNDHALLGNRLDSEVRGGQDGQTKGVPIGPDTSLALAEIVLGQVDHQIQTAFPLLAGARYIDDMYFFTENQADAERLLMNLEAELGEYELQLNLKKTCIQALPQTLDHAFLASLRARKPAGKTKSKLAWADFFDGAFELAQSHPYDNVLRYALAIASKVPSSKQTWEVVQHLLWQSIAIDPGTIRYVLTALLSNASVGRVVDKTIASKALNNLLRSSAPYGHSSEVAWALWALVVLDLAPEASAWDKLLGMSDDVVAISAYATNMVGGWKLDTASKVWDAWLEPGCFSEEHWFFSYEACRQTWCSKKKRGELIKGDGAAPMAKFFCDNGVSFLDTAAPKDFAAAIAAQGFPY
jgi:hypothetical protein